MSILCRLSFLISGISANRQFCSNKVEIRVTHCTYRSIYHHLTTSVICLQIIAKNQFLYLASEWDFYFHAPTAFVRKLFDFHIID